MSGKKTELVSMRLTEEQKETWDSRDDAADLVRGLIEDLSGDGGSNSSSSVAQFVRQLAEMDNRWSVPQNGDCKAVRVARTCGIDLPGDGQRAAQELYSAISSSDVPVDEEFEVSEARSASVRAALE